MAQVGALPSVATGEHTPNAGVAGAPSAAREPRQQARLRGGAVHWMERAAGSRAKLLGAYVLLLAVSSALAMMAMGMTMSLQLDHRVAADLEQEALELDSLVRDGRDPATGQAFADLTALFDVYLRRNVASDDEAMLAYIDGEPYRAVMERYPLDEVPAEIAARWKALARQAPSAGEPVPGAFDTPLGEARYLVAPVTVGGRNGALVVTILPATELREIWRLRMGGAAFLFAVLLAASALAWLVVGHVLRPVQELTETARGISQSDLTRRLEVTSSGEAAEMARSFNAMLDRLETVFESQQSFVEDASHELRDPLTIARGHLELLGDDPVEREATIALVIDEIERMALIVDNLQFLAEAEQPDFVQSEPIDLPAFARQLEAKASTLAPRRWALGAAGRGTVVADRYRLTEAVMNLAHNSVQHTDPADTITIGASLDGEEWRLWVSDTGAGIPDTDKERIFERFARGQSGRRGTGLGLALVRAIAEAHGGRVELDSSLGEGATFTLVLPTGPSEGAQPWPVS